MNRTLARRAGLLAAAAATLATLTPAAAHADPIINLEHDAVGTSHIASTDSDVALGPTTLSTALDFADGSFTGSLPLPGTTTTFDVIGFIPVTADVDFVEVAPVTGALVFGSTTTEVHATATYDIKLSNIKIAGFPTFTGHHCLTEDPVTIPVDTPAGGNFNLLSGGPLEGTFTIGEFENCGLNTWLINALVPGSGNTVDLDVSNGRIL